jgi:hypothetical protein
MVLPGNSESDEGSNSPDGSRRNSVDEQIYFYMPSLQQQDGTFMIPCDPVSSLGSRPFCVSRHCLSSSYS